MAGTPLRRGNKPCGAKTRQGTPCKNRNVSKRNGRCRNHGGASTGPRTEAGLEKVIKSLRENRGPKTEEGRQKMLEGAALGGRVTAAKRAAARKLLDFEKRYRVRIMGFAARTGGSKRGAAK